MKIRYIFLILFATTNIWGQIKEEPVIWKKYWTQKSDSNYTLTFEATIKEKWHLYSQNLPENSTIPTEFVFQKNNAFYQLLGKVNESPSFNQYDEVFQMHLSFFEKKAVFEQKIKITDKNLTQIEGEITYQACDNKLCIFRTEPFIFIFSKKFKKRELEIDAESNKKSNALKIAIKKEEFLETQLDRNENTIILYLNLFLLGFLGGIIALLTPCVFPMIPLTISFFIKTNNNNKKNIKNAVWYGFFIIIIYGLLSLPFHLLDSVRPEFLNTLSTNVFINLLFFAIFLIFALSFFGLFELRLPVSWGNKADVKTSSKGMIGIFFMALTLAIVSFSCTGPILGSLLASSLTIGGGAYQLTTGMLGFGVALALPFTFFAFFPNALTALPKSGTWMQTIKVTLGFIELALALKFLSNADLVSHWGVLKRETFIIIWIVIFLIMMGYLWNFHKYFKKNSAKRKTSIYRQLFGVFILLFNVYLATALFFPNKNNLNLLSGFPPPSFYSIFDKKNQCPLELNCFKEFETGQKYAIENNKPILLDFTGWACVNCRRMEENVWTKPNIFSLLNNEITLISLYIDDRKKMKASEQFILQYPNGDRKKIKTIGEKWAAFQWINFNTASQPFYVLMHPNGTLLNKPIQYTDAKNYEAWLKKGLENFKKTF